MLAILGTIVGLTLVLLILYRIIQRKRRIMLRERINAGEVDIEQLALTQFKVPRETVEKMPQYTYLGFTQNLETESPKTPVQTKAIEVESSSATSTTPSLSEGRESTESDESGLKKPEPAKINPRSDDPNNSDETGSSRNPYRLSHTQTTCAICLDDFVAGSTTVRELPCGHIFDPGCIDEYLTETSSLCPLCKKSVLPAGSCPIQVTNDMVRQEAAVRRGRN